MPERPDLYPPSCIKGCDCSIEESTKLVEVEIPVFVVKHGDATDELPTGAQARGWLSDRHAEAQRDQSESRPLDAGEAAPEITVSEIEGAPS